MTDPRTRMKPRSGLKPAYVNLPHVKAESPVAVDGVSTCTSSFNHTTNILQVTSSRRDSVLPPAASQCGAESYEFLSSTCAMEMVGQIERLRK